MDLGPLRQPRHLASGLQSLKFWVDQAFGSDLVWNKYGRPWMDPTYFPSINQTLGWPGFSILFWFHFVDMVDPG